MTQSILDAADEQRSTSPGPASPADTAPAACPQCGSDEPWGMASWCPKCGYYPALGLNGETPAEVPGTQFDGPANLWEAIPTWLWIFAAGIVAVSGFSIWVSVMLGEDGALRTVWTIGQALLGLLVFGGAHLSAYLLACTKTDRVGPFDYFMKPIEIWKPALRQLPEGSTRLYAGGWSLFAVVAAFLFIGDVDVNAVFAKDWGFEKAAEQNLVHAIVEEARKNEEDSDDLEGAMNEFVGTGEPEEDKKKPLPTVECVVFGYVASDDQDVFNSLLLASLVDGKLRYVGTLSAAEIPEEQRTALKARLPRLHKDTPLVKAPLSAVWLRPVLMCRVAYKDWSSQKRLNGATFDAMLADLKQQ